MKIRVLFLLCLVFLPGGATAAENINIPKPLQAWIPWVLEGEDSIDCPFGYQNFDTRYCTWPDTLKLDITDNGGLWRQQWSVHQKSRVLLPGNNQHWPQDVLVNGKKFPVVLYKKRPALDLPKGKFKITGKFYWTSLPESLLIPASVGLVRLKVNNREIKFPRITSDSRLWLNKKSGAGDNVEKDHLQVEVFRLITDSMPLTLTTRIDLKVSGKAREISLGPVLPKGFIPVSHSGRLPMRLESDSLLKLQVRPGQWTVDVIARFPSELTTLKLPESDLPDSELWVFNAKPSFRLAEIQGVESIDPGQTRVPAGWRQWPVYQMDKSREFEINVRRRGDPDPSPNNLTLHRNLWLDFNGGGFTFQDKITGQLNRSWRLNMDPAMPLGQVKINNERQLVTRMDKKGGQGVEVRHGHVAVEADGRIEGATRRFPVGGWEEDFQQVNVQLNLPPGWRLFSVSGADSSGRATWIEKWSLLDIFLVLIIALAIYRLFGWRWSVLALSCLLLTWHESGAPHYLWLLVTGSLALLKVAPPGRLRVTAVLIRYSAVFLLVIVILPYMVMTVRTAIYPQLDRHAQAINRPVVEHFNQPSERAREIKQEHDEIAEEEAPVKRKMISKSRAVLRSMSPVDSLSDKLSPAIPASRYTAAYDPDSKVQTGPGLPEWTWTSIPVRWAGPVLQNQQFSIMLIPPAITAVLKTGSMLMVLVLAMFLAGVRVQRKRLSVRLDKFGSAGLASSLFVTALPLLLIFQLSVTSNDAHAEMPNTELLNELKQRLIKPPDCLPHCADISRMKLVITPDNLSLMLEVHAEKQVVIPLPGKFDIWMPDRIVMDGKLLPGNKVSASGLSVTGGKKMSVIRGKAGSLLIAVPKGQHQINLAGKTPSARSMQLALPLKPHHITVNASGWTVSGIHADGKIERTLHLERDAEKNPAEKVWEQSVLPPFISVKRVIRMGLDWQVDNTVARISPSKNAITVKVPLLDGESVLSDTVTVAERMAVIHLPANTSRFQWQSALNLTDEIVLRAPDHQDWMEQWFLDVSPVWHAESTGIPKVHHQSSSGSRYPEWRPWPGEMLTIKVTKPQGVSGRTLTIDHSVLAIKPGKRATDTTLFFRVQSSQANLHNISLPEGASLKSVSVNQATQPIRQEGRQVGIPVSPGSSVIEIAWQVPAGVETLITSPSVNLGTESVNATTEIRVPRDRWVLFAGGPMFGPAVLFWGVLLVTTIIAIALGRTTITPLRTHHWMLLGAGLTQAHLFAALFIVGWFFAMAFRKQYAEKIRPSSFNMVQVLLVLLTFAALSSLLATLGFGLLGTPDMQITGNGSSSYVLRWFEDRAGEYLPSAWVVSVPMWFYRALMLLWSLWLAFALLGWLKWSWQCYTCNGLWRNTDIIRKTLATNNTKADSPASESK